jgi:uncharacterized protein (DUF427 family)
LTVEILACATRLTAPAPELGGALVKEQAMTATWNDTVLAQSDDTIVVEGNHYFPPESIRTECFRPSDRRSACAWKGAASYYDLVIGDDVNPDAAWYYPEPKEAAKHIAGYVAFWNGVKVEP